MARYHYRPIRDPEDLRPGERLVYVEVDTGMTMMQGDRHLIERRRWFPYAERATPFRSRLRTR